MFTNNIPLLSIHVEEVKTMKLMHGTGSSTTGAKCRDLGRYLLLGELAESNNLRQRLRSGDILLVSHDAQGEDGCR